MGLLRMKRGKKLKLGACRREKSGDRLPAGAVYLFIPPSEYKRMMAEETWPKGEGLKYDYGLGLWYVMAAHREFARLVITYTSEEMYNLWVSENAGRERATRVVRSMELYSNPSKLLEIRSGAAL
ncbi:MAG: hypothetical protein HZA67_12020 [Rhodospirillales bacterium]|nr:hypothetical protein [Rhodospirillales bacterium]